MRTSRLAIWAVLAALATCGSAAAQNGPISGVTWSSTGRPAGNVNIAVCSTVATTAAAVSSNVATLSFASNPITQGFLVGQTMLVSGFTGGDTYFNGTFLIAATSSSTISYLLVHTNASAGSNGSVQQVGTLTQSCAPLAPLTTDNTGSFSATNPTASDGNGNYNLWVAPGYYKVQTYASNYGLFFYFTGVACVPGAALGCVGTFGGSATASHLIYASGADILADVPGSAVAVTGATTLTAGADTTTPLAINSHSITQSATLLDVNNQASASAIGLVTVRGLGTGSFTPAVNTALIHVAQENQTAFGIVLTNHVADVAKGIANNTLIEMKVNNNGTSELTGGNPSSDGANNYGSFIFGGGPAPSYETIIARTACTSCTTTTTPFAVQGSMSQSVDIFDILNGSGTATAGANSAGGLYVADSGTAPLGSQMVFQSSACETNFGATTVSGGATTTTGLNCLPANSIIDAVVYRITVTITTAVSFTIGDAGSATRYCGTQSTMTAGTTGTCTAAGYYLNASAAGVKFTPNAMPGAGAIRLIVYYHTWTAPTS